jgi:MSHA pilin protein MshD
MFTERIQRLRRRRRQAGVTLVELVAFIVVVSVGVAGLVMVAGSTIRHSADPMIRKQALAIAESLMAEILQQPFTWCDPQDSNVLEAKAAAYDPTRTNSNHCWDTIENIGPETGEIRGDAANPFDNVNDYHGFGMGRPGDPCPGICLAGESTSIDGLEDYEVSVDIAEAGNSGAFAALPADAVLQIEVTVTGPGEELTLTGYRVRYAPNDAG